MTDDNAKTAGGADADAKLPREEDRRRSVCTQNRPLEPDPPQMTCIEGYCLHNWQKAMSAPS